MDEHIHLFKKHLFRTSYVPGTVECTKVKKMSKTFLPTVSSDLWEKQVYCGDGCTTLNV